MGYSIEAIKGFSWMGILRGFIRIITFLKIAILARLLGPKEFGIFGIASLLLAFLEIITETGINAFLIQEKDDLKSYVNTSWVVSIIRGFLMGLFLLVLASPVSNFFKAPESLNIIVFISLIPVVRGFINPAIVSFQKDLRFDKEFYLRIVLFTVEIIVSITLAYFTRSAISMVWGILTSAIFEVIISIVFIKPIPKFDIDKNRIKKVISRGKWMTISGIFDYFYHNGDDLIVGRLLDTFSLGLYQVAYRIATLPVTEAGEVVNKVAFPVYSKISEDKNRLSKAFTKVFILLTVIITPFGLLIIVFADFLVEIFLGIRWLGMVPALRVLVIYGVIRAISGSTSAVFLALKKQEYITVVTAASLIGLVLTIIPLVKTYGILGASWSAVVGSFFSLPFMYYFYRKEFAK